MKPNHNLNYPIFLIESDSSHKFTGYMVAGNRFGFVVFGRVPNAEKFSEGIMFDSEGHLYTYQGSAGWPRFRPKLCIVLDNILIPGLFSKLAEVMIYFGPKLISSKKVELNRYKSIVIKSIEKYEEKTQAQLRNIIESKNSYREVIEGIEWWVYHGGARDADGHPEDRPEYSS